MTEARALASCDGAFGAFAESLQEKISDRAKKICTAFQADFDQVLKGLAA
jgi:hypothetical protein